MIFVETAVSTDGNCENKILHKVNEYDFWPNGFLKKSLMNPRKVTPPLHFFPGTPPPQHHPHTPALPTPTMKI